MLCNVFQLGGAVVLGIGVWTLLDKAFITELTGTSMFLGAVYILIATGGLVTLIAFLGCMGAVKEVKCMLLTVSANTPRNGAFQCQTYDAYWGTRYLRTSVMKY